MKTLFSHVLDPSGHKRILKLTEFPFILGTQLEEKGQLRDQSLARDALLIERKDPYRFVLKCTQPDLMLRSGDLRVSVLDVPFFVKLRVGRTELVFTPTEHKEQVLEFPAGANPWHTESESGILLLNSVRKSSQTSLSIYLHGETGTGKEVLAKLIHLWSPRASANFVPINCGALTISLAESELFGHVKGSYTGAVKDRSGALLQAHGGTLFLDEVGDLPFDLQVKLLRFLESGEIRPVGSDRTLFADVRVICATHKPLQKLVEEGGFRQDLYFRLASIPIEIPSLRSRPEDIRTLALIFSKNHSKAITHEAVLKLLAYPWPGNVRELRHAIERACGLAGPFEEVIHSSDFEFLDERGCMPEDENRESGRMTTLKEMEKILILRALKLSRGNRTDAAKILGIARSTLFEMLKRHQVIGPKSTDLWLENLR